MKVQVRLFAAARQLTGADSVDIDVTDSSPTVEQLRSSMMERYPQLSTLLRHAMFAVNAEYVPANSRIPPGAEVACIPPVSGG